MKLNSILKDKIKAVINNYHHTLWSPPLSGELDFLNRTVSSFRNLNFSAGHQSLKARSRKIHLTPMVRFYQYGLPVIVELSDLLFIYKHFLNNILDSYRAVLIQGKYTKAKKKSKAII